MASDGAIGPVTARVGWNVAVLRGWRRWTLKDLAERLSEAGWSVPVSTLSRIENGTGRIDPELLVALADVLQATVPALLAPTNPEVEWFDGSMTFAIETGERDGQRFTRRIIDYGRLIGLPFLHEELKDRGVPRGAVTPPADPAERLPRIPFRVGLSTHDAPKPPPEEQPPPTEEERNALTEEWMKFWIERQRIDHQIFAATNAYQRVRDNPPKYGPTPVQLAAEVAELHARRKEIDDLAEDLAARIHAMNERMNGA